MPHPLIALFPSPPSLPPSPPLPLKALIFLPSPHLRSGDTGRWPPSSLSLSPRRYHLLRGTPAYRDNKTSLTSWGRVPAMKPMIPLSSLIIIFIYLFCIVYIILLFNILFYPCMHLLLPISLPLPSPCLGVCVCDIFWFPLPYPDNVGFLHWGQHGLDDAYFIHFFRHFIMNFSFVCVCVCGVVVYIFILNTVSTYPLSWHFFHGWSLCQGHLSGSQ